MRIRISVLGKYFLESQLLFSIEENRIEEFQLGETYNSDRVQLPDQLRAKKKLKHITMYTVLVPAKY